MGKHPVSPFRVPFPCALSMCFYLPEDSGKVIELAPTPHSRSQRSRAHKRPTRAGHHVAPKKETGRKSCAYVKVAMPLFFGREKQALQQAYLALPGHSSGGLCSSVAGPDTMRVSAAPVTHRSTCTCGFVDHIPWAPGET